jgi:transposase
MKLTEEHLEKIREYLPVQRKPEKVTMLSFLNAVLYTIENGCKWRALPNEYGNWHTIYTRLNRWCKNGTLEKIFAALQEADIIDIRTEIVCIDSTSVKVHPDAAGALKKCGKQSIGRSKGGSLPRFMWLPRLPNLR